MGQMYRETKQTEMLMFGAEKVYCKLYKEMGDSCPKKS